MDKILTVEDVAAILKVKPITVREMFRESRLRAFKVGKAWRTTEQMLQEDIDAIARGENPPPLVTAESGHARRMTESPTLHAMEEMASEAAAEVPAPAAATEKNVFSSVPGVVEPPTPALGSESALEAESGAPLPAEADIHAEEEAAPEVRPRRKKAAPSQEEGEEKMRPMRDEEPADSQGLLF